MFASGCLESSSVHWVKSTYIELRSVCGLLKKNSWCVIGGHKQHLFQQYNFPFNVCKSMANTNSNEKALLMNQDRGKP